MDMRKVKKEIKQLSGNDLHEHINALRQDLFGLRLNASTSHVKDYSQFKKLRRAIACAMTHLQQQRVS